MRVVALLVFFVLATGAAFAQDNGTAPSGNETAEGDDGAAAANDTAGNDTAGNDTAGGDDAALPPDPECTSSLTLLGVDELVWLLPDTPGQNPRLSVCASAEVVFEIRVPEDEAIPHNFYVDAPDAPAPTATLSPGDVATYGWTTPESGTFEYICQIHPQTMKGFVTVGEAAPPAGGGGGDEDDVGPINGPATQLQQVAPSAPCDIAIPAVVTRDIVGGPTVQDYVDSCTRVEGVDDAIEEHPADLVLPISFALIGLGVLGTVWVHKRYKP